MIQKFKVGDKVKLLYGGESWPLLGYKTNGIYTVAEYPESATPEHKVRGLIPITGGHRKYGYAKPEQLKLVEPKQTKNQRITELEKQVANLLERVEALEKHRLIAGETLDKFTESQADIIEFEGNQYRKVDRRAREGDVIIPRSTTSSYVTNKKPYKVVNEDVIIDDDGDEISLYSNLTNRTPETIDVYEPIQEEKSPNQLRKEIIEKAKKFVKDTTEKQGSPLRNIGGNYTFSNRVTFNRFIVNQAKRTVVVLVKSEFDDSILEKGVAKCHPDDVFNEHIGKAIALGRALGLNVSEFENAVQPTKVVVGMKVRLEKDYPQAFFGPYKTGDIFSVTKSVNGEFECASCSDIAKNSTIIDDTNAQY